MGGDAEALEAACPVIQPAHPHVKVGVRQHRDGFSACVHHSPTLPFQQLLVQWHENPLLLGEDVPTIQLWVAKSVAAGVQVALPDDLHVLLLDELRPHAELPEGLAVHGAWLQKLHCSTLGQRGQDCATRRWCLLLLCQPGQSFKLLAWYCFAGFGLQWSGFLGIDSEAGPMFPPPLLQEFTGHGSHSKLGLRGCLCQLRQRLGAIVLQHEQVGVGGPRFFQRAGVCLKHPFAHAMASLDISRGILEGNEKADEVSQSCPPLPVFLSWNQRTLLSSQFPLVDKSRCKEEVNSRHANGMSASRARSPSFRILFSRLWVRWSLALSTLPWLTSKISKHDSRLGHKNSLDFA